MPGEKIDVRKRVSKLGRRDAMKLGVGASVGVAAMLKAPAAFARHGQQLP